jgi:hypothetical protein
MTKSDHNPAGGSLRLRRTVVMPGTGSTGHFRVPYAETGDLNIGGADFTVGARHAVGSNCGPCTGNERRRQPFCDSVEAVVGNRLNANGGGLASSAPLPSMP